MSEFRPENEPLVAMPEPKPERPNGCRVIVTLIVVFALIVTSASGAIWYFFFREQPQPNEEVVPIVEETAVPLELTAESIVETEPVPAPTIAPLVDEGEVVNRIAYIDDEGQIVAISPDGSDVQQLTDAPLRFQFPAWSPDGRSVAAIGANRAGAGIFVLPDGADQNRSLEPLYVDGDQAPFYLYWSPDSRQVAFLASAPNGMGLHLVQADGSADSQLLTIGGPLYWQWSADSQSMFVHSGFSGEAARLELIATDSDGNGDTVAAPGFFQALGISVDGRYLAYAEVMNGNNSQLVIVDRESDTMVTQRHAGQVAMAWSPSANQLAFTSGTEAGSSAFIGPLRLMDAVTGDVRAISDEPIIAFFWSPDGRFLAALSIARSNEGDINAQLEKEPLSKPGWQQNLPQLRLLVYDVNEDEGRVLLSFVPTFAFASQLLPFFDQYALSHRLWSPDSSALVLAMIEDGRNQIFIINTATGQKRYLADGQMPFWSPR